MKGTIQITRIKWIEEISRKQKPCGVPEKREERRGGIGEEVTL